MLKADVVEAKPIANDALTLILTLTNTQGRTGSDLRTAVGDFVANAQTLLQNDVYAPAMLAIFQKAEAAGITFEQLDQVRAQVAAAAPLTVGGSLVRQTLIQLTLASEVDLVINTNFTSRDQVEQVTQQMTAAFAPAEEALADANESMMYLALINLHATVIAHLSSTGRPLPRMVNYQFFANYSTLVIAYKLYIDASRCDEIREDNDIVHPAFAPLTGQALSS